MSATRVSPSRVFDFPFTPTIDSDLCADPRTQLILSHTHLTRCDYNLKLTPSLLTDLREHAIFALRNLLDGNTENQTLVDSIQPVREADERGVLRDRPDFAR